MPYISESIGTDYMQWKGGDVIFISSPTGSGKTTFVLNVLLPFLARNRQKMLYLVNRKVLKKQLEEEVGNLPFELSGFIEIALYQTIEEKFLDKQGHYSLINAYAEFDCIVCDEAHYFLMDSNYNTRTILSYKFVNDFFGNKMRIYMSATIETIESAIRKDIENEKYFQSYWYGCHGDGLIAAKMLKTRNIYSYNAERKYGHVEINIIKSRDEIKNIVVEGNEKWLVFVDSKLFGKKLMKDILDEFKTASKEESVTFVTSDYESDEEARENVDAIAEKGRQEAKILITTSVLDNGISITDIELRNIIIVADTEIEFIQMLGRKRNDGAPVKLFIYRHDRNHFFRRKRIVKRRRQIALDYYNAINDALIGIIDYTDASIVNINENKEMRFQHLIWFEKLMNNKVSFDDIKTIFFSYNGCFALNMLSLRNLDNLNQYYSKLLKKFDTYGEDTFIREQLLWLGKTEEEIQNIITEANKSKYELSRERVIKELESICDKKISKNEFIAIKTGIASDLLELVEYVGKANANYKTYFELCKKRDRVISKKFMEFLETNCDIPYTVNSGSEKETYIVKKVEG